MSGERKKKECLRKKIIRLKKELSISKLQEKSSKIEKFLFSLPEYKNSSLPMFYVSFNREVSTHNMIKRALEEKKEIAVPLVLKFQSLMLACKIKDFNELEEGIWGIFKPKKEKIRPIPPSNLDLIIVPGIAFDREGNRLGRGKGFYDRLLSLLKIGVPKIALAFSFQIIEKVPTEEKDIQLDKIITEDEIINCKK